MASMEAVATPESNSPTIAHPDVSHSFAAQSSLERARTDTHLRAQTGRTQRLYDAVRARMTRPQVTWGEHLDIFTEPSVARHPLILRRALAFENLLLEMVDRIRMEVPEGVRLKAARLQETATSWAEWEEGL